MRMFRLSISSPTPIRQWILGFSITALIICLAIIARGKQNTRQSLPRDSTARTPEIYFAPSSFDFGTILQNTMVQCDFELFNASERHMRIVDVQTKCSCTAVDGNLIGRVIPPNSKLVIPVEFKSSLDSGPASAIARVFIESGETSESLDALMYGEVQAELLIDPPVLDFGGVAPGSDVTRRVMLRPTRETPLVLSSVKSMNSLFEASLLSTSEAKEHDEFPTISVTFHAPNSQRRRTVTGIVQISTSIPRVPSVNIPVRGSVAPEVEVFPDVLVIPQVQHEKTSTIVVRSYLPSRVIAIIGDAGSQRKELVSRSTGQIEWRQTHVFPLAWNVLRDFNRVRISLLVRDAADRIETRSATVIVKSLEQYY